MSVAQLTFRPEPARAPPLFSLMVVYLRKPHEFVDVLGQEDHVAVWRYHGDEALQRLQVQTVHLSVLIAAAAAAWRERQQTREGYSLVQRWL